MSIAAPSGVQAAAVDGQRAAAGPADGATAASATRTGHSGATHPVAAASQTHGAAAAQDRPDASQGDASGATADQFSVHAAIAAINAQIETFNATDWPLQPDSAPDAVMAAKLNALGRFQALEQATIARAARAGVAGASFRFAPLDMQVPQPVATSTTAAPPASNPAGGSGPARGHDFLV